MKTFRSRYVRRVLVPVMAVSLLSACHTWKHQEMAPSQVVIEKEPGKIRLTMLDGDRMELADPIVTDGEIVGHPLDHRCRDHWNRRYVACVDSLRVPTDGVASIETREPDELATATILVVVVGIVVAAAIAVASSNLWEWTWGGGWLTNLPPS